MKGFDMGTSGGKVGSFFKTTALMKSIISAREAPRRTTSRSECSTVENRQVRIWPSAVRRIREQAPQNGSVTGAIIPISPGALSANRKREDVSEPRAKSTGTKGN